MVVSRKLFAQSTKPARKILKKELSEKLFVLELKMFLREAKKLWLKTSNVIVFSMEDIEQPLSF